MDYHFGEDAINKYNYKIPTYWNYPLTISTIVKVLECNITDDSVFNEQDKLTTLTITGIGMSPTFSFFPVEITKSFNIKSLDKMQLQYKPGTIFVAKGDYGIFAPNLDTIVIFEAEITLLARDIIDILEQNFNNEERSRGERLSIYAHNRQIN